MIFFICNPMVDLFLKNPKKIIKKHKLKKNGYKELKLNEYLYFLKYDYYYRCLGGTSINTAIIIKKKTTIPCFYLGKIGTDENGIFIEKELKRLGINSYLETGISEDPVEKGIGLVEKGITEDLVEKEINSLENDDYKDIEKEISEDSVEKEINSLEYKDVENPVRNITATCFVLLTKKSRSLATYLGGNRNISKNFLENFIKKINDNDILYLHSCMCLENYIEKILNIKILKIKTKVIINLFSEFVLKKVKIDILKKFYEISEIIIGNKNEILELNFILYNEKKSLTSAIINLSRCQKIIISTNGNKDIYFTDGKLIKKSIVENLGNHQINTCGAGDAFAGGILVGINNNFSIDDCVEIGKKYAKSWILDNDYFKYR